MRLAVTSHPTRRISRVGLLPGFDAVYVEDDGAGLVVNTLRTLRIAATLAPDSPWALRAEDDVVCRAGLAECLPGLLASAPEDAVLLAFCSAYNWAGPQGWRPNGRRTFFTYLMAVKKTWIDALAAGVREASRYHPRNRKQEWDRFLTDWIGRESIPAYTHFPSLVQHVGEESLIGHRGSQFVRSPTYGH